MAQLLIGLATVAGLLITVLFLMVLGIGIYSLTFIPIYVRATSSGVKCSILRMYGMKLRGVDVAGTVELMISLRKTGVDASFDQFESHILAGGSLADVVEAMRSAYKAGLKVDFQTICAIDLAGRDVVRAVEACVHPIVINIPPRRTGKKYITGVAQDGIQLGVNVKVTARADIHKLVGGANEETIIARVGEGIVSAIGSAQQHKEILQNPDRISEVILGKGLDSQTAFEIVSVDVGDVEVLENIGAKLTEAQASADQLIAQARAEARRSMAIAASRENLARIREMTALETLNRAEIPEDMARAYQRGNVFRSPKPVYGVISRKLWEA